ncbi:hypothetical protein [Weissella viridescens]|uniref:hypothetical protein n=1 Tax=Weissella viridescens TaxID=1629 RepID=UPI003AF210DF
MERFISQTGLLIEIFNEMGGVWIKLNELDSAKDCLERCLNLTNSLPEAKAETLKLVIVKVYRRKAELAVALEQYAEAIEWVDQAMSVLPKINAYHELVRLQKIKIESAEELDQQSEKKEAMLLAYAAGLFSQDQKLEEETRHYRSEMDSK